MRGGCGLDCRDVLYLERGRQVQAMEHRKSPWINFLFFMADACMTMLAALLSIFLSKNNTVFCFYGYGLVFFQDLTVLFIV